MLDSRPSLRSVAPQVIAPQPVLALSLELESAHRPGVLLMLVLVLVLVLPLICPVNLLLHLTTLWLMHLLQFLILSLFFYASGSDPAAPVTAPIAFVYVAALVSVCAAPASVNDAPTAVPAVATIATIATIATVAPTVPKMPAVSRLKLISSFFRNFLAILKLLRKS